MGMLSITKLGGYVSDAFQFMEWGPLKTVTTELSVPIYGVNSLKAKSGETQKQHIDRLLAKDKSVFSRFLSSLPRGLVLGIASLTGWLLSHMFFKQTKEGEAVPAWLGLARKALLAIGVGAPVAAYTGQAKGFHLEKALDAETISRFRVATLQKNKPFFLPFELDSQFSDYIILNEDEGSRIENLPRTVVRNRGFIQQYITGLPGTGKTEVIRKIVKQMKELLPPDQADSLLLETKNVAEEISEREKQQALARGATEKVGVGGITKQFESDALDLMESVLNSVYYDMQKATRAEGKRLIYVLDEVDKAFRMEELKKKAEEGTLNWGKLITLIDTFMKIMNPNFGDVIFISNEPPEFFQQIPSPKDAPNLFAGFFHRLNDMTIEVKLPNEITQSYIVVNYLKKIAKECSNSKSLNEILDDNLLKQMQVRAKKIEVTPWEALHEFTPEEVALANIIHEKITFNKDIFGAYSGRNIRRALDVYLANEFDQHRQQLTAAMKTGGASVKPYKITLECIDRHLRSVRDNVEKDIPKIDILDQLGSSVIKNFILGNYEHLLKEASKTTSKVDPSMLTLEKRISNAFYGIYEMATDRAYNMHILFAADPKLITKVDGTKYVHFIKLKEPVTQKNNEKLDPNNWEVEIWYKPLTEDEITAWENNPNKRAFAWELIKNSGLGFSHTKLKTGTKFLQELSSHFEVIYKIASRGGFDSIIDGLSKTISEIAGPQGHQAGALLNVLKNFGGNSTPDVRI